MGLMKNCGYRHFEVGGLRPRYRYLITETHVYLCDNGNPRICMWQRRPRYMYVIMETPVYVCDDEN